MPDIDTTTIDHSIQTEKPMCSAKIEKPRLRLAMALPRAAQNWSSCGSHLSIQRPGPTTPGSRRAGSAAAGVMVVVM